MIWWQAECKFGDMIRISFGNFYHYGIFASEDEVIQFGLPPFDGLLNRKFEDIAVCVSDIDTFAGGRVVEVASVEKSDKQKRLSPKKTVQRARERIGEKGYDILHNNCEHFARYCYFGEKRCEVTEGVVNEWNKKTVSDVYFSIIPNEIDYQELQPNARNTEVLAVSNEQVKKSKYWAWKTLEYALFRSFGYKIQDLDIVKTKTGKWVCEKCFFSISHTENLVAVVVSNRETGIDAEACSSFYEKMRDGKSFQLFAKKIRARKEAFPENERELITLWTKKECLFKAGKKPFFAPSKICTVNQNVSTLQAVCEGQEYTVSVIGRDTSVFRFYSYDGAGAVKFKDIKWV
jgi:phosphopantetheinyl transferase